MLWPSTTARDVARFTSVYMVMISSRISTTSRHTLWFGTMPGFSLAVCNSVCNSESGKICSTDTCTLLSIQQDILAREDDFSFSREQEGIVTLDSLAPC